MGGGGGKHFMLNSKNRVFNPYFLIGTSNEKNTFADNLRLKPTILFMEKISFLSNFSLAIFMGNRSLGTVRGPMC